MATGGPLWAVRLSTPGARPFFIFKWRLIVAWRCPCEQCSATPAPTYTQAHRRACYLRWVRSLKGKERRAFLDLVERKRGRDAVIALLYDVATLPPPQKDLAL